MSGTRVKKGTPLADRIAAWCHVDDAGCWIWEGKKFRGYGRTKVAGRTMGAHRAAYMAFVGPIPGDLTVDHLCFVTDCVNPAHLRLLTHLENSRNRRPYTRRQSSPGSGTGGRRGEQPWTHCKRGHELTPDNVKQTKRGRQCRRCNNWRRSARRLRGELP